MCLGDAIAQFSNVGQVDKCSPCNQETLRYLYGDEIYKSNKKVIPFPDNIFSDKSPHDFKYITYQFDKALTQKTWCPEHIFTNRQIYAIYHHYASKKFQMIDIGHYRFSLKECVNLIKHAEMHVGVCSGMGWAALACNKKPDIWYATDAQCKNVAWAKNQWKINEANIFYFDECFDIVPSQVTFDKLDYKYNKQ